MSHANKSNQTEVNGDRLFVNDSDQINDTAPGKIFFSRILHGFFSRENHYRIHRRVLALVLSDNRKKHGFASFE